jgi:hypothetical protein
MSHIGLRMEQEMTPVESEEREEERPVSETRVVPKTRRHRQARAGRVSMCDCVGFMGNVFYTYVYMFDDGHVQISNREKVKTSQKNIFFTSFSYPLTQARERERAIQVQHIPLLHYTHSILNFFASFVLPLSLSSVFFFRCTHIYMQYWCD